MGFPTVGQTIYGAWTQASEAAADLETRLITQNSKVAGIVGDSVTADRAKFNTLVNVTMQPNGGEVDVIGVPRIESNLSIPSNVRLNFRNGAFLAPDGGVTISINGPINAPLLKIFGGAGLISFGKGAVEQLYPQWWGAKGDNVNIDDAPILACVNAAAASTAGAKNSRSKVHFVGGIYLVSTSACLTPTNALTLPGIHFTGSGWYTSIIRYAALGVDTWFYDNGASERTSFNSFSDIGFEGMDPANYTGYASLPSHAKGFKFTGVNSEQGHKFNRCRFSYLDVCIDLEGTNLASEVKFFGCKFNFCRSTVYSINNIQSDDHEFYGCDMEICFGDLFVIGVLGSGAVKMYGGSIVMDDDGNATEKYILKIVAGAASPGQNGYPFIFSGMRCEMKEHANVFLSNKDNYQIDVAFENCYFLHPTATNKTAFCVAKAYQNILFRRCSFNEQGGGQFQFQIAAASAGWGQNGTITFDTCGIPVDWSDRCTALVGAIRATGCYGTNIAPPNQGEHWAHDFDLHWDAATPGQVGVWASSGATLHTDGSPTDNQFRLKTAQLKLAKDFWPTVNEQTLKLPKNAIIKGIHIRKPAGSADATVTQMRVNRNDKTGTAHLDTPAAAYNVVHSADLDNYFFHVANTVNERTLRLYATVATVGAIQGGICIVEYY